MRFRFAILTFLILAAVSGAAPQTNTCQVSRSNEKRARAAWRACREFLWWTSLV